MAGPILVGYDGSERGRDALVLGRVLSSALEAPLVVLIAYTPEQWLWAPGTAEPMDPEKRARFAADAETALAGQGEVEIRTLASQSAAGAFQAAPIRDEVRLRTVIAHGASGDAIVEQSEHVDLLVLGARGCGPLKRVLLGSVSRHVVRRSLPGPRGAPGSRRRGELRRAGRRRRSPTG
jgi:nucleotide-binding universal stress UspA family protein